MSKKLKIRRILRHERKTRSAIWLFVMIIVVIWLINYLRQVAITS